MKGVFIASSPNTQKDDRKIADYVLFTPWKWINPKKNNARVRIHNYFKKHYQARAAFAYNTGRAALYSILKAVRIKPNEEVVIQAFTCAAVPTAILWAKAKPVFTDIDTESLNLTSATIEPAITDKTRAVIVQHTFGRPAEIERIIELVRNKNENRSPEKKIYLIEDCAHSFGAKYRGKKIGSYGDAAFFSFGQDKVISCTRGGLALTNNPEIAAKLENDYLNIRNQKISATLSAILHPILWNWINRTYYFPNLPPLISQPGKFSLGKALILKFRLLGLTRTEASTDSIDLTKPDIRKLSNAQSIMLENQIAKLGHFNRHRRRIAEIYNSILPLSFRLFEAGHIFLRFPIVHKEKEEIAKELRANFVIPGNWYSSTVHPEQKDLLRFGYSAGSCPNAEKAAANIINLPTHIGVSEENAKEIARIVVGTHPG